VRNENPDGQGRPFEEIHRPWSAEPPLAFEEQLDESDGIQPQAAGAEREVVREVGPVAGEGSSLAEEGMEGGGGGVGFHSPIILSGGATVLELHDAWHGKGRQARMATKSFEQAMAELAEAQKRTEEENRIRSAETEKFLRELGKQIGALGEKFGSFTEGMAFPSMRKLLQDDFHMDVIAPRVISRRNGRSMELDVLAYANSDVNAAYVVEVKSHLREDGLEQMRKILRDFREFFPAHKEKKIYGILAAVDAPEDVRQKVLQEGIYLARIHDEEFELEVPAGFKPRAY
jgi:hypothetical protein